MVLMVCLCSINAFAQTFDQTFNVNDNGALPIGEALVTLEGYGSQTTISGSTTFYNVTHGVHNFTVTKDGYLTQKGSLYVMGSPYNVTLYKEGDSCLGGILFYIDPSGEHALISHTSYLSQRPWGCLGSNISGAGGILPGTGASNTKNIVNYCKTGLRAAYSCDSLEYSGYYDWYLPSRGEMDTLYRSGYLSIMPTTYWTSTQDDIDNAIAYDAINTNIISSAKDNEWYVQPIRAVGTPTLANAGADQLNVLNDTIMLMANTPEWGVGQWSIAPGSGDGGAFASINDPLTTFYGRMGRSYTLVWTISNYDQNNNQIESRDTVIVSMGSHLIGEFYQGGIVFYVDQSGSSGLVAAPSDQSAAAQWGCEGIELTNVSDTAIGTGLSNTTNIAAQCVETGIAAKICLDLVLNGYSDWYLPSIDELDSLYRQRSKVGGFNESGTYWSSTQTLENPSWSSYWLVFSTGSYSFYQKSYDQRVRAIRTFSTAPAAPTAYDMAVTGIGQTSATFSGKVNANESSTTVTFEYSTDYSFGNSLNAIPNTIITSKSDSVSAEVTGLVTGTLYHARMKCVNAQGTVYSDTISFTPGTITDIDGNVYTTITIGTQDWMTENLRVTRYRNGDPIEKITDAGLWEETINGAYVWYGNDSVNFAETYGALYNWYATVDYRKLCPAGWHIPTRAEWDTLVTYLGGSAVAGGKLKEMGNTHWTTPNTDATDEVSFNGLPGGHRTSDGNQYLNMGDNGYWWSSTANNDTTAWDWALAYNSGSIDYTSNEKSNGFSARCIRGEAYRLYFNVLNGQMPLQQAVVEVEGLGVDTTNESGMAQFRVAPVGDYNYTITYPGYYPETGIVHIVNEDVSRSVTLKYIPKSIYISTGGNDASGDGSLGSPYQTIGKGIVEALSGDTIKVLSGTYSGANNYDLSVFEKGLVLLANDGVGTVTINGFDGVSNNNIVSVGCGSCSTKYAIDIHGIRFVNFSTAITLSSNMADVKVSDSWFQGGNTGLWINNGHNITLRKNLFKDLSNNAIYVEYVDSLMVMGNTIDSCEQGLTLYGGTYARGFNNIFSNNTSSGVFKEYLSEVDFDYNCYYQNTTSLPGPNDITGVDPMFVGGDDYHLQLGSPCINAGKPEPQYNDPDGTRADMGAFPFTHQKAVFTITADGGAPVANALVDLITIGTLTTNAEGKVEFIGLTSNSYSYRVRAAGYTEVNDMLTIAGADESVSVVLTPDPNYNNALAFDGFDDYVQVDYRSQLNPDQFTIQFWARVQGGSGSNRTVLSTRYDANRGFRITYRNDDSWEVWVGNGVTADSISYPMNAYNKWVHVAATFNGINLTLYLNGEPRAEKSASYMPNAIENLYIGRVNNILTSNFSGRIDEVSIFNYAKTQAEIVSSMNGGYSGSEPGMAAYYKFNQGIAGASNSSHITLADSSMNHFNGALINFMLSDTLSNWVQGYDTTGVAPIMDVSPESIALGYSVGSTATFTIASNTSWNISALQGICSLDVLSGFGSKTITITASETNNGSANRIDTLIIVGTGGIIDTVFITQHHFPHNALAFDGYDDRVTVPDAPAVAFAASYSAEAWIRRNESDTVTYQYILGKPLSGSTSNFAMFIKRVGTNHYLAAYLKSAGNRISIDSTTSIPTYTWTHVAVTYNGRVQRLFVNGVCVNTTDFGTVMYGSSSSQPFIIGSEFEAVTQKGFRGRIDEVRIWDRALTPSEIQNGIMTDYPSSQPNLGLYYKFDQGIAEGLNNDITTLADSSLSGLNGSLNNFSLTEGLHSNFVAGYDTSEMFSIMLTQPTKVILNPHVGSIGEFSVSANTSWTVSGIKPWLNLSTMSCTGTDTVEITAIEANNTGAWRYDTLVIVGIGVANDTVVVSQYPFQQNSLAFDGVDDYVTAPLPMNSIDNFTLQAWMYLNTLPAGGVKTSIVCYGNNPGSTGDGVAIAMDGPQLYMLFNGVDWVYSGYNFAAAKQWHHIALVRNNGTTTMYVDGVKTPNSSPMAIIQPTQFAIGSGMGTQHFDGRIDEVSIWSRPFTQQEIVTHMNSGFPYLESDMRAYFKFNQGIANGQNSQLTSIMDTSIYKMDGSLHGFALSGAASNWTMGFDTLSVSYFVAASRDTIWVDAKVTTGDAHLGIHSNTSWTVNPSDPWVVPNTPSGIGNDSITISFQENTGALRIAKLIIGGAGVLNDTVVVVQKPYSNIATLHDLRVDGTTVTDFDSLTLNYSVIVPYGTSVPPSVTYFLSDGSATANKVDATGVPGTTTITVTAEDGLTVKVYSVEFIMGPQPAYTVTFNVYDEWFNPIENAEVGVIGVDTLLTLADGKATFPNVVNGNYTFRVSLANYKDSIATFDVSDGDITVDVVLKYLNHSITFYVYDEVAMPRPGAQVVLTGLDTLLTDTGGMATFLNLPDGSYPFEVRLAGYQDSIGTATLSGANVTETIYLKALPTNHSITFWVYSGPAMPAQGAVVYLPLVDSTKITDEFGKVVFYNLPDAIYLYTINLTGFHEYTGGTPIAGSDETVSAQMIPLNVVTFNVDMAGVMDFNPDIDTLYIAGSLNGWAEPGTLPEDTLTRVGTTSVWTMTRTLDMGDYEYKYFRNATWTNGEWSGGPNRAISISKDTVINDVWGKVWIDSKAIGDGSIVPAGITYVPFFSDQTFNIVPNLHYQIADVLVDGMSIGPVFQYTFNYITSNHKIEALFEPGQDTVLFTITDESANPVGNADITFDGDTYTTDANGQVLINYVPHGKHYYSIAKATYIPINDSIEIWSTYTTIEKTLSLYVALTGISVNQSTLDLTMGNSYMLSVNFTPENASYRDVYWISSDPNIALVDLNGLVMAKGVGTSTITATAVDGGFTSTCTVNVSAPTILPSPDFTRLISFGGEGAQTGSAIYTDANGVYMAAGFSNTLTFEGSNYTSIGSRDLLLAKYSSTGTPIWIKTFNALGKGNIVANVIKTDASQNIYVAGNFMGTLTVGTSTLVATDQDAFVAKFDANGNGLWAQEFGTGTDNFSDLVIDNSNSVYLVMNNNQLVKYDEAGNYQWHNANVGVVRALATNGTDIIIGGQLLSPTTFGSETLIPNRNLNAFLARADIDGNFTKAITFTSYGTGSIVGDITFDNSGNLIIAGDFYKDIYLGSYSLTNSDRYYFNFIAKCDINFNFFWAKQSTPIYVTENPFYRLFTDNSGIISQIYYNSSKKIVGFESVAIPYTSTATASLFKFNDLGEVQEGYAILPSGRYGTCISPEGKVLRTGSTNNTSPNGSGNLLVAQYSNTMSVEWTKESTGSKAGTASTNFVKFDHAGNMFTHSTVRGYCNYYGNELHNDEFTQLLSKHDAAGNLIWFRQIFDNTTGYVTQGSKIALDANGNIAVGGIFNQNLVAGSIVKANPDNINDGYVLKYNAAGDITWFTQLYVTIPGTSMQIYSVHFDNDGNLLVGGTFNNSIQIGGETFNAYGPEDVFLAKFDADGNYLWAKVIGGGEIEYMGLVATDAFNNIYLSGEFHSNPTNFTDYSLPINPEDGSSVLAKLDPNGNTLWAKTYGGVKGGTYADGWPVDLRTDADGNSYLWGWCLINSNFGPYQMISPFGDASRYLYYLSKIDTNGDVVWAKGIYEKQYDFNYGDCLDLDSEGNVYIGGHVKDSIYIEGQLYTLGGLRDMFVAKYNNNGAFQWYKKVPFHYSTATTLSAIAAFGNDVLVMAGGHPRDLEFGLYQFTATNTNAFIASIGNITTKPVNTITVDPASLSLVVGGTGAALMATILPADATNKGVTWSTSDSSIAVVNSTGKVSPVGVGTAIITATSKDGGLTATSTVTVTAPVVYPTDDWTRLISFGGSGNQVGGAVHTNSTGVYMAAGISGQLTFGGSNFVSVGSKDLLLTKFSVTGSLLWAKQFDAQPNGLINSYKVITDSYNNIYVTGNFIGTLVIGGSTVTATENSDAFIAKFGQDGNGLWVKSYSTPTDDIISDVAVDLFYNLYAITNNANLIKYNDLGDIVWEQNYSAGTLRTVEVHGSTLYIGGALPYGSTTFGALTLNSGLANNTAFIAKAHLDGVYFDSMVEGGTPLSTKAGNYKADGVFVHPTAGLRTIDLIKYIEGLHEDTLSTFVGDLTTYPGSLILVVNGDNTVTIDPRSNVGGSPVTAIPDSLNYYDPVEHKFYLHYQYNATPRLINEVLTLTTEPAGNGTIITDLTFDNANNMVIAGSTAGGITFNNVSASANSSTFIAKSDTLFNFAWVKTSTKVNPVSLYNYNVYCDASNYIYQVGNNSINQPVTFDAVTVANSGANSFMFMFDPDGNAINGYSTPLYQRYGTVVASEGKIIQAGSNMVGNTSGFGNLFLTQSNTDMMVEWRKESSNSKSGTAQTNFIKFDALGNMYVHSTVNGYCNFYGSELNAATPTQILSKHDIGGNLLWMKQVTDGSGYFQKQGTQLALDKENNVAIAGTFATSLLAGSVAYSNTDTYTDGYILKYSSTGDIRWASRIFANEPNSKVDIYQIHFDNLGNLLVSGTYTGTVRIGSTTLVQYGGGGDVFLAKYDAFGNPLWAKAYGGTNVEYLAMVSSDNDNNIYLSGEFHSNPSSIGSVSLAINPGTDGSTVLAKIDPNGNTLWAKAYGGVDGATGADSWPVAMRTDGGGNTYLWGWCPNNSKFGPYMLTNPLVVMGNNYSFYLAKFNSSGDVLWAKGIYEQQYEFNYGDCIDLDKEGNIYVGGHYKDTISIEGQIFANVGMRDMFIAKYDNNGNFKWFEGVPVRYSNATSLNVVAALANDVVVVGGGHPRDIDFGSFQFRPTNLNAFIATKGNFIPLNTVYFAVDDGVNPIPGAYVTLYGFGDQNTDAGGMTTFDNVTNGTYSYTVSLAGYQTVNGSVKVNWANVAETVHLTPLFTGYPVTFNISGSGLPLQGAEVNLNSYGIQYSGADGKAIYNNVANGTYSYTVTYAGYDVSSGSVTVFDAPQVVDVALNLLTYNLTFNVTEDGSPVEGAEVTLQGYGSLITNASGLAMFTVNNGEYSYTVSRNAYIPLSGNVTVYNESKSVDVSLNRIHLDQNIALTKGWNIFSSYVSPDNSDMRAIVDNLILADKLVKVQTESGSALEFDGSAWINGIGGLVVEQGYKIKVKDDVTLSISGKALADPVIIPLTDGWNIAGFPSTKPLNALSFVEPLVSAYILQKTQSQNGAAIDSLPGYGWVNNIGNMIPGQGYRIRVKSNIMLNAIGKMGYTWPVEYEGVFKPTWKGKGYDHMNIYIRSMTLDGAELTPGDEIGIFDGNRCVGVYRVQEDSKYPLMLCATTNDPYTTAIDGFIAGNNLSLRIWSASRQVFAERIEIKPSKGYDIRFEPSGTTFIGVEAFTSTTSIDPNQPILTALGDIYPNPFREKANITFIVGKPSNVLIEVYDLLGSRIAMLTSKEYLAGSHSVEWNRLSSTNGRVAPGIYIVKMRADGYTSSKRIVIE